jgi:hypothetical protein
VLFERADSWRAPRFDDCPHGDRSIRECAEQLAAIADDKIRRNLATIAGLELADFRTAVVDRQPSGGRTLLVDEIAVTVSLVAPGRADKLSGSVAASPRRGARCISGH